MRAYAIGIFAAALGGLPCARLYAATPLVLDMYVNGTDQQVVTEAIQQDNGLWIDASDLSAAGIKFHPDDMNADGLIRINALSGIHAVVAGEEQKLMITATESRLMPQIFNVRESNGAASSPAATGFIGRYDIVGTANNLDNAGNASTLDAALGGTFFTPGSNFSSNAFINTGNGFSHYVRLDSAAEFDQPDQLRRWQFGDAVSGGPVWSRSVRFGGFQLATDFGLRPDLATFPLPAFFGQTAVPATVDVFVNSARVFESNVGPGPFQLNSLPAITGSGDASVVVRDVTGRETTATLPFFASSTLLRPGLESYDLDLGAVRENYGQSSFDYGVPAATATYARGINEALTLEGHSEAAGKVQMAGGGAVFSLGPIGVMHASAAASNNHIATMSGAGSMQALSFESDVKPFTFFANSSLTQGAFADLASMDGMRPAWLQLQAGSSVGLGHEGSLTASWIELRRKDSANSELSTLGYSLPVISRCNFFITGFYDHETHAVAAQATLTLSFGDNYTASATGRHQNNAYGQETDLVKFVNPDGGFGYRLTESRGDTDQTEGEATWIGSHGQVDADLASRFGAQAGQLDVTGGVVMMGGALYTTQAPNGSVALVQTGQPNATIYRENRAVTTTDDDGNALLTGLVPYTANRIGVDPGGYKFPTIIDTTEKTVVPGRQNGVVVDFVPAEHHPALVTVVTDDKNFPPVGARVTLDGVMEPLVVGHHGEIFIADLVAPIKGRITYGNHACRIDIPPPAATADDAIPHLGPLTCMEAQLP